jgi:hypothetical protein
MWVVEYSLPSHLGVWSATPKTKVGEKKMHKSKFCIDCSRFAWLHATKEGKRAVVNQSHMHANPCFPPTS